MKSVKTKKILYKGTLDAAELAKARSLGKFKSGQKGRLEFQLEIPREWDNAYALKKTDITWIFAVKENEKKKSLLMRVWAVRVLVELHKKKI